jgi:predicted dehydrogenase
MIKFAVIGQGHIGKRHAEMIRRNPEAELVAVCDVLPKEQVGLADIQEAYFTNYDEFLAANLDVDVVNICTPNGFHAEYAIKALQARKHVVFEKPIALTKNDAEVILFKSLEMSKHVFCVMQNRYSPPSVWLKEVCDGGLLGDVIIGRRTGRESVSDITLFESQGMAIQDLAVALRVVQAAEAQGLGTPLPY